MATLETELGAAAADLNEARKQDQDEDDDPEVGPPGEGAQGQAAAAHLAQPVPTPGEARRAPSQRRPEEKAISTALVIMEAPTSKKQRVETKAGPGSAEKDTTDL